MHVTQTYFQKGDSVSSTTYNDNVDNWNVSSKIIAGNNVRDQGLDMHSFSANAAIDDFMSSKVASHFGALIIPPDVGTSERLAPMTVWYMSFANSEAYVYRCSINYKLLLDSSSGGASNPQTVLKLAVRWYFRSASTGFAGWTLLPGERQVQLPQEMYAINSQVGDITIAMNLTQSRLLGHLDHQELQVVPEVSLFRAGSIYPEQPFLEITAYTASLTKYQGGL